MDGVLEKSVYPIIVATSIAATCLTGPLLAKCIKSKPNYKLQMASDLTQAESETLADILTKDFGSENSCRITVAEHEGSEYSNLGTCVFLSDSLVLTAGHVMLRGERIGSHMEILSTSGTLYSPYEIDLIAISMKYDMAMLRVASLEQHATVCIDQLHSPQVVHYTVLEKELKYYQDYAVPIQKTIVDGLYDELYFPAKLESNPARLKKGDSGIPVFNEQNCLVGIYIAEYKGNSYFSPQVYQFLSEILEHK